MGFKNRDLSVIAFANGFTLWHYRSSVDSLEDILDDGYFDPVMTLVNTGDIIITNGNDETSLIVVCDLKPNVKTKKVGV